MVQEINNALGGDKRKIMINYVRNQCRRIPGLLELRRQRWMEQLETESRRRRTCAGFGDCG